MAEKFSTLNTLIKALIKNSNIHICIQDLTGILSNDILEIETKFLTHTSPFCLASKNYSSFPICMRSKTAAINKVIQERKTIQGYCTFGLYEFVKPVIIDDSVRCIIFVGNIVKDKEKTIAKTIDTCIEKNISSAEIISHIDDTEQHANLTEISQIPEIIDSYIRLIYNSCDSVQNTQSDRIHWVVRNIRNYIESNYDENITLKSLANLYFMNEKYIGNLFNKQIGCSFRQYLTKIRISHATDMLLNTDKNIIDVAMDCGFQSITYFNRIFAKLFGLSPSEYRCKNSMK